MNTTVKTAASAGIWVTILGLVVAAGCDSGSSGHPGPPTSPETSGRVPGSLASTVLKQVPIAEVKLAAVQLPSGRQELFRFLARQKTLLQSATDLESRLSIQWNRHRAAEKLLGLQLNEDQRLAALRDKLDSLLSLAAGGDTTARKEFLVSVQQLASDSSHRIVETAAVFELRGDLNERLIQQDNNLAPVVSQAGVVARRFPDSLDVAMELNQLADGLLDQGHRDVWLQILNQLVAVYGQHSDPRLLSLGSQMQSRVELAQLGFDRVVNRLRDGQPDAPGEFAQLISQMLANPELAISGSAGINRSIEWLELSQQPELARQTNQLLRAELANITNPGPRQQLERICDWRAARLELAGQPLPTPLPTADGESLDRSRLAGRNVVLIFWSPAEPESVELIKQTAASRGAGDDRPWEMVGICFSKKPAVTRTLFGGQLPPWPIVISTDGSRDLAHEFGISRTPHVMLLDASGVVMATAFPPANLPELLQQWTAQPDSID